MRFWITNKAARAEEIVIYALLVVVGAVPLSGVLIHHTAFGAEATLGLIVLVLGALGLFAAAIRAAHRSA